MLNMRLVAGGVFILATVLAISACDRLASLTGQNDRNHVQTKGLEHLRKVIHLDPNSETPQVLQIQNLIQEKQFEQALHEIQALESQNATAFNLKGGVYLHKNDLANARKSFERALALDDASVAAAMNLAQLDLLERTPEAAQKRFQAILAKDASSVGAMLGLAGVAAAVGKDNEYVDWLEKAAKAAHQATRPRLLLADFYLQRHEVRKALALAREAQTASPDDPQAMQALGTAQLAAGDTEGALASFGRLVRLVPKNPVAHYKLATAHAARQEIDAVRNSLNAALALKPDYLDAAILLVSAELGARRPAEAMKIALRIQAQHPHSASGFALEGDALLAQNSFPSAVKAYERAFQIQKSGILAVRMHQALHASGNSKEADARLAEWLKDHPGDITARAYSAATHLRAGQRKRAIQQYELVLQAHPENVPTMNDLAWLYQQEKDPRALATAERAYQLRPDHPQIMDTLGWILVQQGNTARGLELLQKATDSAGANPAIRYHWAAALAKSGDKTRARRELEDLLARNIDFRERNEADALLGQLRN